MALELCSESSGWAISPRISFSHDLSQNDRVSTGHREDALLLDSTSDFDFCIFDKSDQESSSADELFSNGKILPLQIKKPEPVVLPHPTTEIHQPVPKPKIAPGQRKESLKEILAATSKEDAEEKPVSKSFWRFSRSSSLNCSNGSKGSLMCSLPGLSRSNSTGSNQKRPPLKDNKCFQKPPSNLNSKPYSVLPKPPLKKNEGGRTHYSYYSNGVRISPVLNVPPPYITKGTSNLFSLGYSLCRKDKNRRKPFP